jgi:hypothetical protein
LSRATWTLSEQALTSCPEPRAWRAASEDSEPRPAHCSSARHHQHIRLDGGVAPGGQKRRLRRRLLVGRARAITVRPEPASPSVGARISRCTDPSHDPGLTLIAAPACAIPRTRRDSASPGQGFVRHSRMRWRYTVINRFSYETGYRSAN